MGCQRGPACASQHSSKFAARAGTAAAQRQFHMQLVTGLCRVLTAWLDMLIMLFTAGVAQHRHPAKVRLHAPHLPADAAHSSSRWQQ
jgi:hypothetical protein